MASLTENASRPEAKPELGDRPGEAKAWVGLGSVTQCLSLQGNAVRDVRVLCGSVKHLTRSSCSPVLRSAATPWTRACCRRVTPTPTQQNSVALSRNPLLLLLGCLASIS